jgi:RHS repeat-associated protein
VTENWCDAAGRRIAKREGGVLTLYGWEGMVVTITTDSAGSFQSQFTRGPGIAGDVGSLIAAEHINPNRLVFRHSNHRGDVVLATAQADAVVGRYDYSAFGMQLTSSGSYAPRFGFSSKERDASGLVYYGFRFHSPDLCRWITPDPIKEDGGLNLCQFCVNDPVNEVDAVGLDVCPDKENCWLKCMSEYPYLKEVIGIASMGLVSNMKSPSELRPGSSMWTSLDRRLGIPIKGRGAVVFRGAIGRVKYVGRAGTVAAAAAAFGAGYALGASVSCLEQCMGQ